MHVHSLSHLADATLRHALTQLVIADRSTTARLVTHIAEFDARRLFLEDGYPSMYDYCLGELGMSEDVACRRIRAARAARRFPIILHALADGRIHLTGVALLAPRLTEENAEELLASAFHKSKAEILLVLAERFPQPDLPTFVAGLGAPAPTLPSSALGHGPAPAAAPALARDPQVVDSSAPARMDVTPPRVTPLAPERFAWQLTVGRETQDLLREVQDLLGPEVPPGDLEAVIRFSLRTTKQHLERRKLSATDRPRAASRRPGAEGRHVPAEVRRAVWTRDQGRCTFVSDRGHRCAARRGLEFDHVDPFARGGEATIGNVRLLCRAHNQHQAERTLGAEFMRHKRQAAAEARAGAGGRAAAAAHATAGTPCARDLARGVPSVAAAP